MSIKYDNLTWNIIQKYFEDNPQILVKHQINSYNDFFRTGIKSILKERNPIILQKEQNDTTNEFKYRCELYLGGKDGSKLYYGKPVIYDENREHFMYPNEARLRNMNYGITIHFDLDVDFFITDEEGNIEESTMTFNSIFLGRFPVMIQSDLCILNGLNRQVRFNMGECKNDYGGYFIIDGKEKVIVSQEKFADNMLYIRENYNEIYSHGADIRTVSEDASKPERTLSVRIVAPSSEYSNNQIVVNVPNVRKPIPLFILFRALGVISDKEIIEYCLLDIEKNDFMVDLFIPSIHDAGQIFSQETAIEYIKTFTKGHTVNHVLDILMNYFLPNVGEQNFQQKAYFLGYIVYNLLLVFTNLEKPTDRDSFNFKRVEVPGTLIYDLFKEYYKLQQDHIKLKLDTEYNLKKSKTIYQNESFKDLVTKNYDKIFSERIVENGFKKAFKGNWGAHDHTKKIGIVQDLNRLSYNSYISHLRKINLPMDSTAKVVKPRLLHGSQWGLIDPVDTPDGGNIGFHKHMSISTHITSGCSSKELLIFLRKVCKIKLLQECTSSYLYGCTKVMVNGVWIGVLNNVREVVKLLKLYKRNGLLPLYTSVSWNIKKNELILFTDAGRLCRPVFYVEKNKISFQKKEIIEKLNSNNFSWVELVSGFAKKKDEYFDLNTCKIYNIDELYETKDFEELKPSQAIIEYIDTSESENALISSKYELDQENAYTHAEIHPSLLLGVMGNQIVFPENNQLPRDLFSCGQSKQAVSIYNTNFLNRIDKSSLVLNYGQVPLIKSRYLNLINNEEHPYGENVIVAIMVYGGYNVEDSILFNKGSIDRGMFRTTYYNSYESREESSTVGDNTIDSHFENLENVSIDGVKFGYDYSSLDKYGLIKENTQMDDQKIIIGKIQTNLVNPNQPEDVSVYPKKGQLGYVDKTFMTEDEEGFRLAKVRIREERIPSIGDKFCSRCGQKGTVGLIIPEENMPFTENGMKPDIIINPHALPSRMTIGQLVETLMGKACSQVGGYGDCTAFVNKGSKHELFGKILTENDFHSSGNEILYNGNNGEQLNAEIFIGPTYYMRLKHMVKDKINFRGRGPVKQLTKQPLSGRANDGGLRIGEMERDAVISHGMMKFLQESFLERADEFYIAVCNNTGSIAIYNNSQDIFIGPMVDGPIKFEETIDKKLNIVNVSKFGRSFSILKVPYAFKLLIHELQAMNVQMRIITDENVDQLTSMSYSNNIMKMTNSKEDLKITISNLTKQRKNIKITSEDLKSNSLDNEVNEPISLPSENVTNPEEYGWSYFSYDENKGEVYKSLIINTHNKPTEVWFVGDNNGELPNRYPKEWDESVLFYYDETPIYPITMINELKKMQVPNNWPKCLDKIKNEEINKPTTPLDTPPGTPPLGADGENKLYDESTGQYMTPPGPGTPPFGPNEENKLYDETTGQYITPPGTPPFGPNEENKLYDENTGQYITPPGTPPFYKPVSPDDSPPYNPISPDSTNVSKEKEIIVLDSNDPILIMPKKNTNKVLPEKNIQEIEIKTDDDDDTNKINELIEESKNNEKFKYLTSKTDKKDDEKEDEEKDKKENTENIKKVDFKE